MQKPLSQKEKDTETVNSINVPQIFNLEDS
jgi:hypothetical protein